MPVIVQEEAIKEIVTAKSKITIILDWMTFEYGCISDGLNLPDVFKLLPLYVQKLKWLFTKEYIDPLNVRLQELGAPNLIIDQ